MNALTGLGLVGMLIVGLISILPWVALMCIWSNTGKTAKNTEKMLAEMKRASGVVE